MTASMRPLDATRARAIARAYLPDSPFGSRYHYVYTRAKLASDPLYPGVAEALRGTVAPLLDLGCGLGLLAHTLRADGIDIAYRGVDVDARKIARAQRVAERAGLCDVAFDTIDLARDTPVHSGSVAILDVLQYVDADAQARILDAAIGMLSDDGRLVIRTGLDDGGRRLRVTHFADRVGRMVGWMYSSPRTYPREQALRARLEAADLRVDVMPLYGNTPFNNWRIVAHRRQAGSAGCVGPAA